MNRDQSPTRNLEELLGLSASAKPKSELANHGIPNSATYLKDVHEQISGTIKIIGNKLNDLAIDKERVKNKYLSMLHETEAPKPQTFQEQFSKGLSEIEQANKKTQQITNQQIQSSERKFLQKCWELEDRIDKMQKFELGVKAKNSSMKAQWAREIKQVQHQSIKWNNQEIQGCKTGLMENILEMEMKTKKLLRQYIEKQEAQFQSIGDLGLK